MYFAEYLNQWAAATPQDLASCTYCFTITSPQSIRLQHSRVNEITIPIEGQLATQFLFQIHNHLEYKPWRVISEFLFLNRNTHSISIPLLTPYDRILRRGEPICHFTLILPNQCLQKLRGISKYLHFILFTSYFFVLLLPQHIFIYSHISFFSS